MWSWVRFPHPALTTWLCGGSHVRDRRTHDDHASDDHDGPSDDGCRRDDDSRRDDGPATSATVADASGLPPTGSNRTEWGVVAALTVVALGALVVLAAGAGRRRERR